MYRHLREGTATKAHSNLLLVASPPQVSYVHWSPVRLEASVRGIRETTTTVSWTDGEARSYHRRGPTGAYSQRRVPTLHEVSQRF